MSEKQQTLVFEDEEAREAALAEIPDEAPPGVNIENWTAEQEAKEREILDAPLKGSEAASEEQPPAPEQPPVQKEELPAKEEDEVDFASIGRIKRSELDEDLRNYKSPQEMLKQAAHARRYANKAEKDLLSAQERIAELEATAKSIPDLQKQLEDLKKASADAARAVVAKPSISSGQRAELKESLKAINEKIAKLSDYEGTDVEAFQSTFKDTVSAFGDTLTELDSVKSEFAKYRKESDDRYQELQNSIKNVSESTQRAEWRRKTEREQKEAEKGLAELQRKYKELATSKPLYADDRNDVETSIVRFANRVYGRKPETFDEVNRLVAAFNAKDKGLMGICQQEGISPADFGINEKDIRNYGILMNIYWRQRGERIDSSTGKRVPVTDWRGQKVTFPDFDATFLNMKNEGGISQLENEAAIVEAEKKGQQSLNESISKRDTSPPTLGPTGAPPEGQAMSKEEAYEILGEIEGKRTIDEEAMEKALRRGSQKGWDMWAAWVKAHETLEIPVPKPETYWKRPKPAQ